MFKLPIKPLSLNHAYRGRRFSTPELKMYKHDIALLAPKLKIKAGKLKIRFEFGVSHKGCDGDNLIKCAQDSLADKYGFNDNSIYKWEIEKIDVPIGKEYIAFEITTL